MNNKIKTEFGLNCIKITIGRNFTSNYRASNYIKNELNYKKLAKHLIASHNSIEDTRFLINRIKEGRVWFTGHGYIMLGI